jgi:hypothetical protein
MGRPEKKKDQSKTKALAVTKKNPQPLVVQSLEMEIVQHGDPIDAAHEVVRTVGEAAKAVTHLVNVLQPLIEGFRRKR